LPVSFAQSKIVFGRDCAYFAKKANSALQQALLGFGRDMLIPLKKTNSAQTQPVSGAASAVP